MTSFKGTENEIGRREREGGGEDQCRLRVAGTSPLEAGRGRCEEGFTGRRRDERGAAGGSDDVRADPEVQVRETVC